MPRDGSGVYSYPAGTLGTPSTTIESAKYNSYVADVTADLNAPRPIVAGGTGATSAAAAMTALGGEMALQVVTNYNSFLFQSGSFTSAPGATNAPDGATSAKYFYGTAWATGSLSNSWLIEAVDLSTLITYRRFYNGTTWGAWKQVDFADVTGADTHNDARYVNVTGDTMSGDLVILKNTPTVQVSKTSFAQDMGLYGIIGGKLRWFVDVGDSTLETGSNVGSDFDLHRYADDGSYLGTALNVQRSNGNATFNNLLTNFNGNVTVGAGGAGGTLFFGNAGTSYLNVTSGNLAYVGGNFTA